VQLISNQALKDYMIFRRETCSTLALKAGCHRSLIGHLRSGERNTCSPRIAAAIEEALNAPSRSLFMERMSAVSHT
jgi:hypothetical protein